MGKFDFKKQFEDDHFARCSTAENLTTIFDNSDEGLILSINSAWGTGKTKFVEMWSEGLNETKEFRTIYLNAWEADYYNDPLLSLLLAIEEYSDTFDNVGIEEVRKASGMVFSNLIKKGTFDVIDLKEIKKELIKGTVIELKERLNAQKNIKLDIKDTLESIRHNKKVVFFVDELDRAKPNYVVELIELIKHYFKVEGYYFVLMTDRIQFDSIIKHYYGNDIGTADYLRKIIDYDFSMKQPSSVKYFEVLVESNGLRMKRLPNVYGTYGNASLGYYPFLYELFIEYIELYKYSLRDVDKLIGFLKILLPTIKELYVLEFEKQIYNSVLLAYLVSVRIKNIKHYQKLINDNFLNSNGENFNNFVASSKIFSQISTVFEGGYLASRQSYYIIYTILKAIPECPKKDLDTALGLKYSDFIDNKGLIIARYLDFANQFNLTEE